MRNPRCESSARPVDYIRKTRSGGFVATYSTVVVVTVARASSKQLALRYTLHDRPPYVAGKTANPSVRASARHRNDLLRAIIKEKEIKTT